MQLMLHLDYLHARDVMHSVTVQISVFPFICNSLDSPLLLLLLLLRGIYFASVDSSVILLQCSIECQDSRVRFTRRTNVSNQE